MRIMHVITRRELRGAEVVAAQLCEQLVQRGHTVLLVGLFRPPDQTAAEQLTRRVPQVRDLGGPKRRGLDLQVLRGCGRPLRSSGRMWSRRMRSMP